MEYEQVDGRAAVTAMLRRLADGVESTTIDCAGLTLSVAPTVVATMCAEEMTDSPVESITVRLGQAGVADGASALERELAHPGD
ncbi:hypothetical protein K6U06_13575 [Acidiferrimicrobium sp. IK]|uniref:hypothetical protein n=1 Tax=Acidiferrimicrobium sp. IK TaxID=2871700 RepID=UPI0021CAFFEB|nr:hypothetical protein [Acidiferrimicrobium sp. IK]MCU4185397.1 hypothetical protein [Acidiferrimicrobium sp. IK]